MGQSLPFGSLVWYLILHVQRCRQSAAYENRVSKLHQNTQGEQKSQNGTCTIQIIPRWWIHTCCCRNLESCDNQRQALQSLVWTSRLDKPYCLGMQGTVEALKRRPTIDVEEDHGSHHTLERARYDWSKTRIQHWSCVLVLCLFSLTEVNPKLWTDL